WQANAHLVEIDETVAEVLVVVVDAWRPLRLHGRDARGAFDAETAALPVQVITGCGGEAQQQGVRVAGDGLEAEGLRFGQWIAGAGGGQPRQAQSVAGGARQSDRAAARRGRQGRKSVV